MSLNHPKEKKVSYYRKPDNMTVEEWQIALRRQFAEKQNFEVTNTGNHPVFSDFRVFNPLSGKTYKVAIRSDEFGDNFCSCPDFKITELGTCKHIEYVLKQLKANPANNKYWEKGYARPYSSLTLKYGRERKVALRTGTVHREEILRLARDYFDENGILQEEKYEDLIFFIEKARQYDPAFKVYPDALDFILDQRTTRKRRQTLDRLFPEGVDSKYFDGLIKTRLYPYQKEGVLKAVRAGRIIIADDMGLGKTIQAIAATEILAREFRVGNVLIICPTSLKYQWKNEIEKFTDRSIQVVEGTIEKRKKLYRTGAFYKIASYGVGLHDVPYLNEAAFDLVILDEAQRIKNWKTKTAMGLKQLESQYAIVMTGTPLENKIEELHSIVEFINPYKLGALFRFLDKHQIKNEEGKVIGYQRLGEISEALQEIIIRRTKKEILHQLPKRIDKNYFVGITKEQREIHEDYKAMVARLVNKWRRLGFLPEKDRQRLLIALSAMRMVSDSTYILDQESRYDKKIDELVVLLKEIFETPEDKVVIFSQWERMTRLVGRELRAMNIDYEYLHGGVPSVKRKALLDNFRDDPAKRVFLSTDAGGVGLNLQSANVVINLDLPWNPAVLEQRISRIHRLGQQKTVRVINLISRGTIEHRILGLLQFKKSLFRGVLDDGEDRIIMDESRFTKFMKSVEELTETEIEQYNAEDREDREFEQENRSPAPEGKTADIGSPGKEEKPAPPPAKPAPQPEMAELFSAGALFLEKIGNTLGRLRSGEIKVEEWIEKDEKTGQTALKIPIKNEEVITHTLQALAGMFETLMKH